MREETTSSIVLKELKHIACCHLDRHRLFVVFKQLLIDFTRIRITLTSATLLIMSKFLNLLRILAGVFAFLTLATNNLYAEAEPEWSGSVSLDARLFANNARFSGQEDQNSSIAVEPELYVDRKDGNQRIVFHPFLRYDSADDERTHADIRELYWRGNFDDIELKVGIAKVFWGVTESQHLVDIINQTDLVENIDTEDKLGQPMVNLTFDKEWGTLELYLLPYFRERTFPGTDGRLRAGLVVDTDDPVYESSAEETHVDLAVRWSHYVGEWDIGVAHFSGTSREPLLLPNEAGGNVVLTPFYQQIDQTSLDLQATKGDWLWKLEAIYNQNDVDDYYAFVGGFEYTLVGAFATAADLGLLVEYHYDDRDSSATTPFQDDIFLGARLTLNDAQSSELLAGIIVDTHSDTLFGNIEASRRIGQSWKVTVEARWFSDVDEDDIFYDLRQDDYVELQIAKFF